MAQGPKVCKKVHFTVDHWLWLPKLIEKKSQRYLKNCSTVHQLLHNFFFLALHVLLQHGHKDHPWCAFADWAKRKKTNPLAQT